MKFLVWIPFFVLTASLCAHATEEADLKLRLDGYVQTMMKGEKAAILKVKDYYSTVYVSTKGSVESLQKKPNGSYEAELRFETTGKILQDAEASPPTKKEIKAKETVKKTVVFRVDSNTLKWLTPLEFPFVKAGSEKRYLLETKTDGE